MSDKTKTERLRAMLGERGIEYATYDRNKQEGQPILETSWGLNEDGWCAIFYEYPNKLRTTRLVFKGCGPEQAVAATLGPGTCGMVERNDPQPRGWYIHYWECGECGEHYRDKLPPRFCPGCGRRVVAGDV